MRTFGQVTSCPTAIILSNSSRSGSVRIRNQSMSLVRGQIVTAPSNRCKNTLDQSCPRSGGRSSRSRMTLKFFVSSCLSHCSAADSKKFPRQPAIDKLARLQPKALCNTHLCPSDEPRACPQNLEVRRRTDGRGGWPGKQLGRTRWNINSILE